MSQKRMVEFDSIRALCMIWIVGITHMSTYSNFSIESLYLKNITLGVLATFIFLSGIFCGRKMQNAEDVQAFYKKRFIRIYPLFLASCSLFLLTYYIFHFNYIEGLGQFLLTITGIACFIDSAPKTVWFISLLLLLYLITPVIVIWKKRIVMYIISVIMIIAIYIFDFYFSFDYRVSLLIPFYILGVLLYEKKTKIVELVSKPIVGVISMILYLTGSYFSSVYDNKILIYIYMLAFMSAVCCLGSLIIRIKYMSKIMTFISYGSMTSYLFHRFFFGVIFKLVGIVIWPVAIFVLFPIWIVISYFLQLVYDRFLDLLMNTQKKLIE